MVANTNWQVVENSRGEMHDEPVADTRAHEHNRDCWCRPWKDENIWVHNASDRQKLD